MSDVDEVGRAFDQIVEGFDKVGKVSKAEALQLLVNALDEDGSLPRRRALHLAERTGWGLRTLFRWRAQIVAGAEPEQEIVELDPSATFLDRLEAEGASGFVFDELALTMVYALGGNRSRFRREVLEAKYPMPSEATLSRRWNELPRHVRDGAKNGHRNRFKNVLYVRKKAAGAANEVWQLDDFDLDLRVLVDETVAEAGGPAVEAVEVVRTGGTIAVRPHLTLLVDEHSRFITGWMLLDRAPTAADTTALFADAFEVRDPDIGTGKIGGLCSTVICDNARSFTGLVSEEMFVGANVAVRPAPAYSPISKGIVERTGQTIQSLIVTGLAGIVAKAERRNKTALFDTDPAHWLTFEQLEPCLPG